MNSFENLMPGSNIFYYHAFIDSKINSGIKSVKILNSDDKKVPDHVVFQTESRIFATLGLTTEEMKQKSCVCFHKTRFLIVGISEKDVQEKLQEVLKKN